MALVISVMAGTARQAPPTGDEMDADASEAALDCCALALMVVIRGGLTISSI